MTRFFLVATFVLTLCSAALAQAPDPAEILDRFEREIDEKGALRMDSYLTGAITQARTGGQLDADWARVMLVNATLILPGLARYERGMALLEEAEQLVPDGSELNDLIVSYKVYFHAWFGQDAQARADMARISQGHPWDILGGDEGAELRLLLDTPVPVEDSQGFLRVTQLMAEATQLSAGGDHSQARSMMRGLRLPPPFDDVALVRLSNALQSANLAIYAQLELDAAQLDYAAQAFEDLALPGSEPPEIRPGLLGDAETRDLLIFVVDMMRSGSEPGDGRHATLDRWMRELTQDDPTYEALDLTAQIDAARSAADWTLVVQLTRTALQDDTLTKDVEVVLSADLAIAQGRAALAQGRAVDHQELANGFQAVFEEDSVQVIGRLSIAAQVLSVYHAAGHHYLGNIVGIALHDYVQQINRATGQTGEAVAAQSKFWRGAASLTIETGFELALVPPDGSAPPGGLCQNIIGIEVCTLVLELR